MLISLLIVGMVQTEEIPAILRTSPTFSNIIGTGSLTVIASSPDPTTLTLGDSIRLHITVANARDWAQARFPLPELPQFRVESQGEEVIGRSIVFRYRLTPRSVSVTEVPSFRFEYYLPEAAEGKRLRTKYTQAIPLTVKPKEVVASAVVVPERFRTLVPVNEAWQPGRLWLFAPLLAIAVTMLAVWHWRARNPQGARLAALMRTRSVRTAMHALTRAERSGDKVADSHKALQRFLQDRPGNAAIFHPALAELLQDFHSVRFSDSLRDDLLPRTREMIVAMAEVELPSRAGGVSPPWQRQDQTTVG